MAGDPGKPSGGVRSADELGAFWDAKYEGGELFGNKPNEFVAAHTADLAGGAKILVPGDGYGRNGVWLAARGFVVTSIDVSPLATEKARRLAKASGVEIEAIVADLAVDWQPERAAFAAVAVAFVHIPASERAGVHHKYVEALTPGGRLIFQAYSQNQIGRTSGGPKALELLYTTGQLAKDFADLEIESLEEHVIDLDEGTHHSGPASVISMVARKPA